MEPGALQATPTAEQPAAEGSLQTAVTLKTTQ